MMFKKATSELKYIAMDWIKYMDTVIPKGVNRKLFTHLKYGNKNRIKELMERYPDLSIDLLEKQAIHEYLQKSDEQILEELGFYYGGQR